MCPPKSAKKLKYSRAGVFIWSLYDEELALELKSNLLSGAMSTMILNLAAFLSIYFKSDSDILRVKSWRSRQAARSVERELWFTYLT